MQTIQNQLEESYGNYKGTSIREPSTDQPHKKELPYLIRSRSIGLVSLFNGISTFGGYLMPKSFS